MPRVDFWKLAREKKEKNLLLLLFLFLLFYFFIEIVARRKKEAELGLLLVNFSLCFVLCCVFSNYTNKKKKTKIWISIRILFYSIFI